MSGDTFEFFEAAPSVEFHPSEYVRLLGFPAGYVLEGRARELAESTQQWFAEYGRPWIYARLTQSTDVTAKEILLDGRPFYSARLSSQLLAAGAAQAVLVAVSAGPELEAEARRRWEDERPDEYYFFETYGSVVVESLVACAAGKICAWADQEGMSALPHYSPGYAGWHVSEQVRLWEVIRKSKTADVSSRLRVLDTGMLNPKKSVLAVVGLTRHRERVKPGSTLTPCTNCVLAACSFRRAPYRHFIRHSSGFLKTIATA